MPLGNSLLPSGGHASRGNRRADGMSGSVPCSSVPSGGPLDGGESVGELCAVRAGADGNSGSLPAGGPEAAIMRRSHHNCRWTG